MAGLRRRNGGGSERRLPMWRALVVAGLNAELWMLAILALVLAGFLGVLP